MIAFLMAVGLIALLLMFGPLLVHLLFRWLDFATGWIDGRFPK